MTPLDYYKEQCAKKIISEEPAQLDILQFFQSLQNELIQENHSRRRKFFFWRKPHLIKGIYLWGNVGIGKTFLMDCFFHTLPFSSKIRIHFYQFMQQIHTALRQHQGKKDPLKIIAGNISSRTWVLCFDEFFVSDITDAMLLGRLFRYLFLEGVCLVMTSNVMPDALYKNGLQREQFLPAIDLLKQNTHVVHLSTKEDYRLRHLKKAGVFYTPLDKTAEENMEKSFIELTQRERYQTEPLLILDRLIPVVKRTEEVVWFEFEDICRVPRSQNDYLAIAKKYKTVFISHIPVISPDEKDTICLFISLVDVLYDARVRLVISAAEPVSELYCRGYKTMEYTRTHSRLLEMQSQGYYSDEYNARFNQETLARWQDVQQGNVIDHSSVIQWLDTWGTEKK